MHEYGYIHDTMTLLKQVNKTWLLTQYEQLYIQAYHQHKQLIPDQHAGDQNPIYRLIYNGQVTPHPAKPPEG
jgi:hypothetical protein